MKIRKPYERKKKTRTKKKWPGERSTKHEASKTEQQEKLLLTTIKFEPKN
jgi:hypothetical protein